MDLLTELSQKYAPLVVVLLALIVADLLSGVLSALKRGVFHWRELANVYRTNVIPKVGGWLVVTALVETLAHTANLPDLANTILQGVNVFGFYPLVVADLLASLTLNLQELARPAPAAESVAELRARR